MVYAENKQTNKQKNHKLGSLTHGWKQGMKTRHGNKDGNKTPELYLTGGAPQTVFNSI